MTDKPASEKTARVRRESARYIAAELDNLKPGESFGVRYVMTRDGLRVIVEPKRLEIA